MASTRPALVQPSRTVGKGATSSSSSSYNNASRRHSLFGTEDRIVLDIGSKVSKFGFSGEARPRVVIDSIQLSQPSTSLSPLTDCETLWDLDIERCPNERVRKDREALLLARLTQLLRSAFLQHLMVDPKQRKLIIVENAYTPSIVKELTCKVLFNNLQVPSVSFIPSPLLSLIAVGKVTGLVVECGYHETSIVPVYYSRPMMHNAKSTPRAGRSLNRRIRALLLEHAKYVPPQSNWQAHNVPAKRRATKVPATMLSNELIEELKAKALFVGSYAEGLENVNPQELTEADSMTTPSDEQTQASPSAGLPTSSSAETSPDNPFSAGSDGPATISKGEPASLARLYRDMTLHDEASDVSRMQALKTHYSRYSAATPFSLSVPSRYIEKPGGDGSHLHAAVASSSTSSLLNPNLGHGIVAIPGWVRERAAEVMFEAGDEDHASLIDLAMEVILKLPIDLRRTMCENIVVSGGTAMLPGMVNRFKVQLAHALSEAERRREAAKGVGAPGISNRGLHTSLAVLNDPWAKASKVKTRGGSAPAFSANMLPFIGASLAGVLKTSALSEITREAYDEALAAAERLKDAARGAETQPTAETASATRPMFGAGNRGSFVGVVGGLETGAFGALAAVSRHLLVGGGVQARNAVDGSGGVKPSVCKNAQ